MTRTLVWWGLAGCAAPEVDVTIPEVALWSPADPGLWGRCDPAIATSYEGDDAWTGSLRVEFGAIYCSLGAPERSLGEDLARRALVYLPPGTYALPGTSGASTLRLPACVAAAGAEPAITSAAGPVDAVITAAEATWNGSMPATVDGSPWTLDYSVYTPILPGEPATAGLDGRDPGAWEGFGGRFALGPDGGEPVEVGACRERRWTEQVTTLPLATGAVRVTTLLAADGVTGQVIEVAGVIDGEGFAVSRVDQLAHQPAADGATRAVGARFDAPVAGAAGLVIEGLGGDAPAVWLADASLSPLTAL